VGNGGIMWNTGIRCRGRMEIKIDPGETENSAQFWANN